MQCLAVHAIPLIICHRRNRRVNGYLMEICATEPGNLGIDIGMDAAGQQRAIAKVDSRSDMRCTKCNLLSLGKKIVGIAVENHASNGYYLHQFLGDKLGIWLISRKV